MIPAHARPAHRRLRAKLAAISDHNESSPLNRIDRADHGLGIIVSGVAYAHAREAAPNASILKLGTTYPLPMRLIREFVDGVARCVVIEEGDPYLVDALRAEGMAVVGKDEMYRFGELNVPRVQRIVAGDTSAEAAPPRGKPPALCPACPYRPVFDVLKSLDCIVAGDIGCYTLGALPPISAMDTQLCMGASIGVGLGLRHALPENEARRVVSIIGDSTFMHSGLTGLAEMVYNPPPTGHVLIVLDNGTTAMTGQQEHPGTGRKLNHDPSNQVSIGAVARGMGMQHVYLCDPVGNREAFETLLKERLAANDLALIIAKKPCILAAGKIRAYEQRDAALRSASDAPPDATEHCAACSAATAAQRGKDEA